MLYNANKHNATKALFLIPHMCFGALALLNEHTLIYAYAKVCFVFGVRDVFIRCRRVHVTMRSTCTNNAFIKQRVCFCVCLV